MGFYQFKRTQLVNATLPEVWDFISSPANLKKITPPEMGFNITSGDLPEKMYEGMIVSYKVSPLPAYTTTWVTEITHIKPNEYFVDEQRLGPYTMWHHQHFLEETKEGILMTDIVSYVPPLGFLGAIGNTLLIKRQLNKIFDFRVKALEQIFS